MNGNVYAMKWAWVGFQSDNADVVPEHGLELLHAAIATA